MAISKENKDILVKVGIVTGVYFFIVRPILKKMSIVPNAPPTETIISSSVMKQALTPALRDKYPKPSYSDDAWNIAGQLQNDHGYFNDDENDIYGIMRNGKSLLFLSHVAWQFKNRYNQDLLTFLTDFLNDEELNNIKTILTKLPVK